MTQNANFFKLGLFVILSFVLFAGFLIAFGAGQFLKKELIAETCFDESVQGLDIGSEVKFQGMEIGKVKSITTPARIYQTESRFVLVRFSISDESYVGQVGKTSQERMEKAIAKGLRINLAFKGLTGAAYLETNYFPDETDALNIAWEPEHLYIPSRKSSMKRLESTLTGILENLSQININGITNDLETLVETLNQKLSAVHTDRISDQAEALLKELRQTNQGISDTLKSDHLKTILEDSQTALASLKAILQNAGPPLDSGLKDFQATLGNVKNLTRELDAKLSGQLTDMGTRIDTLLESINKTAKMLESLVWLNSDTVNQTIGNLEQTSENLKQLTHELIRYPGRLLLEKPPEKFTPGNQEETK